MTEAGRLSISVAMATHNGERYVAEQLAGILASSTPPDEIVVSDDASRDGTVRIVAETARQHPHIRWRLLRNAMPLGVTRNFERAIGECSGDVVVLSDQDDVWYPDRLACTIERFAVQPSLELLHADADLVDGDGAPLHRRLFEDLEVSRAELAAIARGEAFPVYLRRNLATGATVAFRRSLADRAMPFPPGWVHDEWLAVVAAATGEVAVVRRPLIAYRQHGANQIGVARPTLRRKLHRVTASEPGRNARLAERGRALRDRLATLGAAPAVLQLAQQKTDFEAVRAAMPSSRLARVPRILALLLTGRYRRLASRRSLDAIRDLLRAA